MMTLFTKLKQALVSIMFGIGMIAFCVIVGAYLLAPLVLVGAGTVALLRCAGCW